MKADYLAERSIQDNIVLESSQNASIVVISYILMFLYVSIAIGFFPNMIHMKFGLGLVGILVVIFSLFAGIGLTFYWNQKITMISFEVVPFLILAIGVDNMFLISRAEREIPESITAVEERIGFAMKEIGPSIFTAALCESLAFFIGLVTDVPALQNFCLVAGLGVVEVARLYTGDLVNHMNPEVGWVLSDTFSDVGIEAVTSLVVVVVVVGGVWLVAVVVIVDFLKGL